MQLNTVIVSPGGNTTALVTTQIPRAQQPRIAQMILLKHSEVEQVGYLERSSISNIPVHLEMMGDEFCGNAARALGFCLWTMPEQLGYQRPNNNRFALSVSGISHPVHVAVNDTIVEIDLSLADHDYSIHQDSEVCVVSLPGITVILTPGKHDSQHAIRDTLSNNLKRYQLESAKAVGMIYYRRHPQGWQIDPFVWVRRTDTIIHETACASAVMAFVLQKFHGAPQQLLIQLLIQQPSGTLFRASLQRCPSTLRFTVSSPVTIKEWKVIMV